MKISMVLAASAMVLPLVAGCSASGGEDERDSQSTGTSSQALTFDTKESDHIAGRFEHGGVAVRFDFSVHGTDKNVRVATESGAPLVESTIHESGAHTTHVLGERLVVEDTGDKSPKYTPKYTGDRGAEKELHAMPESEAMAALEPALETAGIASSLLPTVRAGGSGLHTASVGYGNCGGWISQYGWATCGTWFLGWTSLHINTNCSSNSVYYILDGNPGWTDPWCASYDKGGWYWGRDINFYNAGAVCNTATCFHWVNGVTVQFGH